METICNILILLCVAFTLYFLYVVVADAVRNYKEDQIESSVKFDIEYLKESFWYHFPKL